MESNVLVKVTVYEGYNGGGWEIRNLKMGTIKVEGKTPQTRLNKATWWCAGQCKKEKYSFTTYEVIGEKSTTGSSNGIYSLDGFYGVL